MDSINTSISPIQMNRCPSISFTPNNDIDVSKQKFINDVAAFVPNMGSAASGFDMLMNNFAAFKDIISVAQGGISSMKEQGESIRDLVMQAQTEGVTPELMDKIQEEVNARVAEINKIRNTTEYCGINPLNEAFSLDVPNILELMGTHSNEETTNAISDMMASFDIDMSIEGNGFSIGGSAKIEIGYTEDGALQINVDARMDYDLSGLVSNGGVTSEGAYDLINNFINMLGAQQGEMGNAQNFLDAIFEQIFNVMANNGGTLPEGLEVDPDSSNSLKGTMAQQASITLDGMAGQAPNIAINIL